MAWDTIYGGGGNIDAMMRLAPAELIRVTEAEIHAISES
jgi:prolyl-tRNA editing enzyme YbaK/EbsC (Cys-tRNA(Pro) deacylase)